MAPGAATTTSKEMAVQWGLGQGSARAALGIPRETLRPAARESDNLAAFPGSPSPAPVAAGASFLDGPSVLHGRVSSVLHRA